MQVAEAIKEILIETNGTYLSELHSKLKDKIPTRHRDYLTTVRLANALARLNLIELSHEVSSTHLLSRRVYRVNQA